MLGTETLAKHVITVLSMVSEVLIILVSVCWSLPNSNVRVSEPAKSTKFLFGWHNFVENTKKKNRKTTNRQSACCKHQQ